MTLEALRAQVSAQLGAARMAHTLSVEEEVTRLAGLFAFDAPRTEKLRIAALLHDITKETDAEGQFALCRRYGIPCGPTERMAPQILHAATGAAYAAEHFGEVADRDVCLAIASHTTGHISMTVDEILLFLADFIEPGRKYEKCQTLRARFYEGLPASQTLRLRRLYEVTVAVIDATVMRLLSDGAVVFPCTVEMRNELLLRLTGLPSEKGNATVHL